MFVSEVAPHAGAWIEIQSVEQIGKTHSVAPHAGAWIEIITGGEEQARINVAPHAGAWIEICESEHGQLNPRRRSPRGSVD